MHAQIEALEKQADEVVLLESRAELAESERDALLEVTDCGSSAECCVPTRSSHLCSFVEDCSRPPARVLPLPLMNYAAGSVLTLASKVQAGRALTPRPSRELPAAERMLGAGGLATLKAAIDDHKCAYNLLVLCCHHVVHDQRTARLCICTPVQPEGCHAM